MNLTTPYLGFDLANPIVPSASPLTGDIDSLLRLQGAGASAVVLPSLFEEQIEHEVMAVSAALDYGAEHSAESAGGYFPEMDEYNTGPDTYLGAVRAAKEALSIPVIASLNGSSPGGWVDYASALQEAGADALELNVFYLASNASEDSNSVENRYVELLQMLQEQVT
ncbi:MAG: dihydroorotate dehydrogenase-like protein, partial [bacterium]|nr:dihydroorotate dehydrogenase-like protein [bacterium]